MVQLHLPPFYQQIEALDAQLMVVSFAPLERLQAWVPHFVQWILTPQFEERGLSVPANILARTRFVADPTLDVYHAYGLDRMPVERAWSLKILRQYAKWKLQGKRIEKPSEDTLQRGGDFVVNSHGLLTLSHTGADQSERPSPTEIVAAFKQV